MADFVNGYCTSKVGADFVPDCNNPMVPGLEREAVIINREDIDWANVTYSATEPNVVTELPIVTGARGYRLTLPTKNPFNGTGVEMVSGDTINDFTNTFVATIMDNSPEVNSAIIDGLANGTFIVVFENKHKKLNQAENPGSAAFQIMGMYTGLNASALSNGKYATETKGGWLITLTEVNAPLSAVFLYNNDYATTKTLFNNLTEVVTAPGG